MVIWYLAEENVKKLVSQSFVEQLFPLLRSDDAVLRRNTTMVFGILSGYFLCRAQLRKITNHFPVLLKLLQDDLNTTKEFALMTIKNMCQDYISIHDVLERRGLPLLIDCLRVSDPDVQKNAIDALYLIMQDFEARPVLKSANGLAPIVDLLDSEYPVIQESGLRTLISATHDASVRSALLDTSVLDKFVKIVGNPELYDLHVSALGLIANMLEDPECAKVLINTGRLQLLLHYVTDKTVYKDSELTELSESQITKEKPTKGKKQAAKGSPRKHKGEILAEAEKDKTVTSITPEAKIHACQAMMRAAHRDDVRKILHDADVERMLVALLSHEDEGVRSAAANAISAMAESFTCQERFFELGAVELLIRLARGEHRIPKSAGVTALAALTKGNSVICREVASRNSGLEALVTCLQPREPEIDTITVGGLVALTNIALDETTKAKVAQVVLGKPLAFVLKSSSQNTLTNAAMAIAAVAYDQNTVHQFVKHGGLDNLLNLLDSQSNEVRRAVCWAIYVLSAEKSIAKEIANLG
ncbi:unnamed protein product [Dicrocoelium dendriticum]|nr:unnamed protein product [Dicrocoelium dendriticum]